jgi:signal transduction histidine kinase
VILGVKSFLKRHWPALHLRSILLAVLLFAAAMPAIGAVGLRVYENTLVRQTEAELVVQGAALAAAAAAVWPSARPAPPPPPRDRRGRGYYHPFRSTIDLSAEPFLPERPRVRPSGRPPDPEAVAAAARLGPILDEASRGTLASYALLDRNGQVVRGLDVGGDLSGLVEVRSALKGRALAVLRRSGDYHRRYSMEWLSRASAVRVHYARPIMVNGAVAGVLLISRSPRAMFRDIYEDRGKLIIGVLVIIGTLVVLAGLVSRGVTRPIEALSRASREVAAGRGEVPEEPPTAAIEIRALYRDFRTMAEAIARRSRYLRDFAAAVSHEFKTPLAGITGAVELLQDHYGEMSRAERERFLANIAQDSRRLSQLVARLLDLARADMARPDLEASTDVAAAVRRAVDATAAGQAAIAVELAPGLPEVAVPQASLEAVLSALIDNSLKAGARKVEVSAEPAGEHVRLGVVDDGPGIAPADRERLFEPFFTTRRAEGGTGLGLAIARSLMQAHGGELSAPPTASGARFELSLPVEHASQRRDVALPPEALSRKTV